MNATEGLILIGAAVTLVMLLLFVVEFFVKGGDE